MNPHRANAKQRVPREDWAGRNRATYEITRALISSIVAARFMRVEVEDEANVPSSGPVILMINHLSNLDPLLIGWATQRPLNMPGKAELFKVPILRAVLSTLGCYPVNRNGADAASLRRSLRVLRQGRVLAVFPEGTRSRTGAMGQFGPTLTRMAMRERVPVVPVAISGTDRILPPAKKWPRLGVKVLVKFGLPLDLSLSTGSRPTDDEARAATERIRRCVMELKAMSHAHSDTPRPA